MMKKPEWPFVIVHWRDSVKVTDTWVSMDDAKKLPTDVISCGWMIYDEPDHITICASIGSADKNNDREVGEVVTIPRGCIEKDGIHTFDMITAEDQASKKSPTVIPFENPNE